MRVAEAIIRARRPDRFSVCGVPLRDFSIGHWLHLVGVSSSFCSFASEDTLDDLIVSVLICSETYESFLELSRQPKLMQKSIAAWHSRLTGGRTGRALRFLRSFAGKRPEISEIVGFRFQDECEKLQQYLEHVEAFGKVPGGSGEGWASPTVRSLSDVGFRVSYVPEPPKLLDCLVSECGIPASDALNMPLPQARWTWAIHEDRKCRIGIYDADIVKEQERLANEIASAGVSAEEIFKR